MTDHKVPGISRQDKLQATLQAIESALDDRLRYFDSHLHGLGHLREVALIAGRIALAHNADVEAAMVGGFLHDCGRYNDNGGNRHALDSAKLARPLLQELWPYLPADKICYAIATHADGMTTEDCLVGAIWDADRLTLTRLGRQIRPDLLSTDAGRRLAQTMSPSMGAGSLSDHSRRS